MVKGMLRVRGEQDLRAPPAPRAKASALGPHNITSGLLSVCKAGNEGKPRALAVRTPMQRPSN